MAKQEYSSTLPDEELVRQIQQGNSSRLFEVLYMRYQHKVMAKCHSLVRNHSLAAELTEDILSKAFEKLAGFQHKASFSSWLYTITYNHCIDYLREKKALHYPSWNRDHAIPEIIDESEENLEAFNYENLLTILDMIHPEEKALLLMKYQDNLSLRQIRASLRISEDAAKMRLKRARTRVIYLYTKKFTGAG